MPKVLFIPLNTNHILIFRSIIESLKCEYEILCHDKISEAGQYHTEKKLNEFGLRFKHFSKSITRSPHDNILAKILNFIKMKTAIRDILKIISPKIVVLAMDNDPIAQIVISNSKRLGFYTVLVQEALIRPYEYTMRQTYFSDYVYNFLRLCGIYLN